MTLRRILALLLLLDSAARAETGFEAVPGWPGDDPAAALAPLLRSCSVLAAQSAWAAPCAAAAITQDARGFFERWFRPVPLGGGLLTGYYEPELRGSRQAAPGFAVPLHALPPEGPLRLLDRTAIEVGGLDGQGLELVFVDDPVDAFFLQVQGSGRIRLEDGTVLRLGYAGRNAHPYRAIGRSLIARGAIAREAMSMQAIRAWLAAAPPAEATALLRENPAYVFFRPIEGLGESEGPIGTLGVPLTPGRSLAVDPAHIPLGAPVFLSAGGGVERLVIAQDTGGAIRGPARGDLFWGTGEAAGARAGPMQEPAQVFLLLPRDPS